MVIIQNILIPKMFFFTKMNRFVALPSSNIPSPYKGIIATQPIYRRQKDQFCPPKMFSTRQTTVNATKCYSTWRKKSPNIYNDHKK
jgi:hypothetical protein